MSWGIMIVPAIKIAPSLPRRLPRPSLTKGSMEMSASRNKIAAPAKAKSPRLFSRSTHVLEIPRLITTAGVASPALANLLRTDPTQRHKCWYREQGDTKKDGRLRKQLCNHAQTSGRQGVSSSIKALVATYPSRHRAPSNEAQADGADRWTNDAAGRSVQYFGGEYD